MKKIFFSQKVYLQSNTSKRPVITLFLIFINLLLCAQNRSIDSLNTLLNSAEENNNKARICLAISNEYWSDNPDQCFFYAKRAIGLSHGKEKSSIDYEAFKNMGAASSFKGNLNEALRFDLLGLKEAVKLRSDSLIGKICVNIADDYTILAKYDSANIYLDLGINIAKRESNFRILKDLYLNKGNNQYYASNVEAAEESYAKGLKIAEKLNDEDGMAQFYNNIASIRMIRGLADIKVFTYINKAIRINEKNRNFRDLGDNYTTLAQAYSLQKDNERTLEYLRLGYQTFFKIDNKVKAIPAICSLADLFREMNKMDSALYYADKAISIGEGTGYIHGLGTAYSVKGIALAGINDMESAENYLRKAYNEFVEINAAEGILFSGNQLVLVLIRKGKIRDAETVALHVLRVAEETNNNQYIRNITQNLSEIYYLKGNYVLAYKNLKRAYAINDTLTKIENKKILDELQVIYQTEKKQQEIEILKLRKDQQQHIIDEQDYREKMIILFGVTLLALISVSIALIYFTKRNKRRNERIMNQLKISKSELNVLRARMNPHFIFNAISNILGLVNQNRNTEAEKSLIMLGDVARKVLEITDEETTSLNLEIDILKEYLELQKLGKTFNYTIEMEDQINAEEIFLPPLILQPIVENSLVHGYNKTIPDFFIRVNVRMTDKICTIDIFDNGIGFNQSSKENSIFTPNKKSYGLKAIEESLALFSMIKNIHTRFEVKNRADEDAETRGTKVCIEIEQLN